jgi:hypothetical protein
MEYCFYKPVKDAGRGFLVDRVACLTQKGVGRVAVVSTLARNSNRYGLNLA